MHLQSKDRFYDEFLKNPTKEAFLQFMKSTCGEMDEMDFKGKWIGYPELAKLMLAMANSLGGIILFGVSENNETHEISLNGIDSLRDKADVNNGISKYLPSTFSYEMLDFSYDSDIYPNADGKKYQIIVVPKMEDRIPFISQADSDKKIEKGAIYVRRGTKCEKATPDELSQLISTRIGAIYKKDHSEMTLQDHLKQLKLLYDEMPPKIRVLVKKGTVPNFANALALLGCRLNETIFDGFTPDEYVEEDNPQYPKESYEQFIAKMIEKKKARIMHVLDV